MVEVIVSLLAVITGIVIIFHIIPTQIIDPNPMAPNSQTFPYVISTAFTIFCCRWAYTALREYLRDRHFSLPTPLVLGVVVGTFFLLIMAMIESAGYLIGGFIATAIVIMAIEGLQRWKMAVISAIGVTIGFAFFFGKLLSIELPAGLFSLF